MSAAHDDHGAHGGDDHGHGHSPWIQHHYDDAQHQFDSGKLGIWLFLAQEVLFFSALFVAYILYRHHHPEIYAYAHKYLDVKFGAINTAVLIFSSLTAAWAVRAAQMRQRKLLIACLAATLVCAMAFLAIKYIEYTHKVHEHLLFGKNFDPCITASGKPLITKNNACPGSKGSVIWDYDKSAPQTGCFPAFALDLEPLKQGVQAECQVAETKMVEVRGVFNPESKSAIYAPAGDAKPLPIPQKCKPGDTSTACWRTSHQPAVCRPGWFYSMRCTSGPAIEKLRADLATAMASALATSNKAGVSSKELDAQLAALNKQIETSWVAGSCGNPEVYRFSSWHAEQNGCAYSRSKQEKALLKARTADLELKCPTGKDQKACFAEHDKDADLTTFTVGECVRSEQVGLVVEHHDHDVRPADIVVTAQCTPPAKPGTEGDVFAEKQKSIKVGAKAISEEQATHEHGSHYDGAPPEHTGMFFTIYFAMTGLHGIHVLVGVFVFIWLLIRAVKGHFTPEYFGPVDWAALYWHIVDLIWIFLFPLMYLIH